jgi:hypothetical protein
LWKKNCFLRKIEIFFLKDLLLFLKKMIFFFFAFLEKSVILGRKK